MRAKKSGAYAAHFIFQKIFLFTCYLAHPTLGLECFARMAGSYRIR